MKPAVLLTGATGYIASHTWLALLQAGFDVVGVDDFSNSSPEVLKRLAELSGTTPTFERADVCDAAALEAVFQRHRIDATVHFAAFKAVGESTQKPLAYYANNIGGLLNVCRVMQQHGVHRLVFSSSATVYGDPASLPITENFPLSATNPYGQTKLIGETILRDLGAANASWQTGCLRYFNPVGAHESGRIGEDPRGIPNNLMPYVAQVAVGLPAGLRQRLPHDRRHRGARLHPCRRPRRRPRGRAAPAAGSARQLHGEPRHRARLQRARSAAGLRPGLRPRSGTPGGAAPAR
jgi:UDP-glucose 4-epimerase